MDFAGPDSQNAAIVGLLYHRANSHCHPVHVVGNGDVTGSPLPIRGLISLGLVCRLAHSFCQPDFCPANLVNTAGDSDHPPPFAVLHPTRINVEDKNEKETETEF